MSKNVIGVCKLCGQEKKLTFEHVPPRKAFNSSSVRVYPPEEVLKLMTGQNDRRPWDTEGLRYITQQNGSGGFYLCRDCNSNAGTWYVREYVDFTKKLNSILSESQKAHFHNFVLKNIYPLRIFKAIMLMFCDIYHNCFEDEELRAFLLDKESNKFNLQKYSLYIYFTNGPYVRKWPLHHVFLPGHGFIHVSEISQYPLGLLLFIDKPKTFQPKGINISAFSQCDYNYHCDYHFLGMPFLETNTPFALDYRTQNKVISDSQTMRYFSKANLNR